MTMGENRLRDLVSHAHHRIQRRHRLLKYHGNTRPAHPPHLFIAQTEKVDRILICRFERSRTRSEKSAFVRGECPTLSEATAERRVGIIRRGKPYLPRNCGPRPQQPHDRQTRYRFPRPRPPPPPHHFPPPHRKTHP